MDACYLTDPVTRVVYWLFEDGTWVTTEPHGPMTGKTKNWVQTFAQAQSQRKANAHRNAQLLQQELDDEAAAMFPTPDTRRPGHRPGGQHPAPILKARTSSTPTEPPSARRPRGRRCRRLYRRSRIPGWSRCRRHPPWRGLRVPGAIRDPSCPRRTSQPCG